MAAIVEVWLGLGNTAIGQVFEVSEEKVLTLVFDGFALQNPSG